MSGSFCRDAVFGEIYGSGGVCLFTFRVSSYRETQKKNLGVRGFWGGFGCFAFHGRSRQKNPGKIGFFGGHPCLLLLLVSVAGWLRPKIFVKCFFFLKIVIFSKFTVLCSY